jgi:hypothetical protein
MAQDNKNQGEGDRESARRYNRNTQDFVESGKVDDAARRAGEGNREEGEQAEKVGRERAKEFDPAVERDYSKPSNLKSRSGKTGQIDK